MATTTDSTPTPKQGTSIDEALGQTEFGGWIAENKTPVLAAVILLVISVFVFGGYRQYAINKNNESTDALYAFVTEQMPLFEKGTLKAEDFSKAFVEKWQTLGSFEGATPFALQVSDALSAKKAYAPAHDLMMVALEKSSTPQSRYFVLVRAAVLAEDLGKKEMAVEHLKEILSSGVKFMEGKTYLDLGRLYLESGDKEKAKTSFTWVVEKAKEAEFKKMAQLYLDELNQ